MGWRQMPAISDLEIAIPSQTTPTASSATLSLKTTSTSLTAKHPALSLTSKQGSAQWCERWQSSLKPRLSIPDFVLQLFSNAARQNMERKAWEANGREEN